MAQKLCSKSKFMCDKKDIHTFRKQPQQIFFTLLIIVIDTFEKNNFTGLSNYFLNAGVSFEVTYSI